MVNLEELNEPQKKAVLCDENHILVIAGAGSGKTKVLTTRIAYLLELGVKPDNILALTFTNKASKEMRERIAKVTGLNEYTINATTFHSFAVKILRKHITELGLGYTKNFKIYDEDDCKKIMNKILENLDIDTKAYKDYMFARKLYNEKGYCDESLNLNAIIEFNHQALKDNSLTFDDLMFYLHKTLSIPEIANIYQNQFEYILADEFQDTDALQHNILKILSQRYNRLFVVGDDGQSIYRFRTGNSDVVHDFINDFEDTQIIKLEQNYRSTPEILDLANHIIANNPKQIPKTLFTKNEKGLTPVIFTTEYYKEENERIITLIKQLHENKGFNYKDIAILYRVNSLSRTFEDEFIKNKIPYVIYNGTSFYQREEIKDVVSYLRIIADENDNQAFKRIVNKPRRKVGEKLVQEIEMNASKKQGFFYSMLTEAENYTQTKRFFEKIMIAKGKYINDTFYSISELVNYIMYEMDYADYVYTLSSSSSNDRYKNIEEFKNIIKEFERTYPVTAESTKEDYLNFFLQSMALYTNTDTAEDGEEKDAVKLMTVHASKGLEFPVVFLPALEEEIFPSSKAFTTEDIEEERRLFYVGITRAKKYLFITNTRKRMINGRFSNEIPSRFLREAKDKTIIKFY